MNVPISPHRIDVQQGNALEQEAVDKLKVGMTHSQVRFLLGTPLLVDPFHSNRWDYVYSYRTAGKLTEKKRLTLIFDREVLVRIEGDGFPASHLPALAKSTDEAPSGSAVSPQSPSSTRGALAASAESPKQEADKVGVEKSSVPVASAAKPVEAKKSDMEAERGLDQTSIVPPLVSPPAQPALVKVQPAPISDRPPEPVSLQTESNVGGVKADLMPPSHEKSEPLPADGPEAQVLAAMNVWGKAWQARDEEAYLASYAKNFHPQGGSSRAEWEKRRRLLLGISKNIDLKIDSASVEMQGERKALVTFNQLYRSDTYQDAVIKQLSFVLVDGRWLIEEEKVLGPLKTRK